MRYSFSAATERIEAFHLWRGIGFASAEERTPPGPLLGIRGGDEFSDLVIVLSRMNNKY